MAKKKGTKKEPKLAQMTEEERILYLEQKALAEAEMRKKKEEMLMLFLKVGNRLFTKLRLGRIKAPINSCNSLASIWQHWYKWEMSNFEQKYLENGTTQEADIL